MTTLVNTTRVYDEVIDFIAAGTTPLSAIDFQLSDTAKERLEDLDSRAKTAELSPDEKSELDKFLAIEHIMRLAKAKAHQSKPVGVARTRSQAEPWELQARLHRT